MILAVLQARMSSSRLPGKVLLPLLGVPMILRQVERIRRSRMIGRLVLATSVDGADAPLAAACQEAGVAVYRGSLEDVLDRFHAAAAGRGADQIVRLTGDCPLCDPGVIDDVIRFHLEGGFDYSSNTAPPTFPDGLDVEVFRIACLDHAWREASLPSEREHVTPYIRKHKELFSSGSLRNSEDLSAHRWTVDEAEDYAFVVRVYENLYPENPFFGMNDVLKLVRRHPEFCSNYGLERNAGFAKSLREDALMLEKNREGRCP